MPFGVLCCHHTGCWWWCNYDACHTEWVGIRVWVLFTYMICACTWLLHGAMRSVLALTLQSSLLV